MGVWTCLVQFPRYPYNISAKTSIYTRNGSQHSHKQYHISCIHIFYKEIFQSFQSIRVMAEKNQQTYASANGYSRTTDHESAPFQSDEELKRKKRIKLFTYIGIFIVFQIIVMTVFGLTVMKVKTPKAKWGEINVQSLTSVPATPSFDTKFTTQIRIKNTNWGPFKFDASTATFLYQGAAIGQVAIPKSKAGMRSTKKIDVEVSLNTNPLTSSSTLGSDLSSGVLTVTSQVQLKGKVELMLIMKKNKNASMNCTVAFDLSAKNVKSLECK